MRVAVLGRTRMLYDTINALSQNGEDIVLIGTCKASPEYEITEKDFKRKAKSLEIPFFESARINDSDIIELLRKVKAEIAVSVNWLSIIGEEAIKSFRYGILNAHCGDLPRYKGNACPNWAIIKGESEYAISIHYMEANKLDSGDIVLKKYFPINEETTISDIYKNMENNIPQMFCEAIKSIEKGKDVAQKQKEEDSLRCYPRIPTDSFIDWNAPCDEILKIIRASSWPFEGAFTYLGSVKIHIMSAASKSYPAPCFVYPGQVIAVEKKTSMVEIAAGDGIIIIKEVYVNGQKYKSTDFLKSTRIRLNYCLHEEIYQLRKQVEELRMCFEK